VSYFKSLKHFYNEACRNFIRQHPGRRITKEDFGELLKLAWDKSAIAGNLSSGFLKCGIYPYNPHILAEDIFEYQPAPVVNGDDGVRLAEDTADSRTSTSTPTSFEELSPLPKITFPSDPFIRKGRKKQESAVVTSADFRERLRESTQENGRQRRSVQNKKTTSRHSERRIGRDGPSCSTSINSDENYCGVCSGYYYDDKAGEQWVQCVGSCGRWFHEICVENGEDMCFICDLCL
jgi:hypothetical protein